MPQEEARIPLQDGKPAGKRPRIVVVWKAGSRSPGQVVLQIAIPLKVTGDGILRRQPFGSAPIVGVLKVGNALVAYAYKGSWLQVETEDGRSGWINQRQIGAR